MMYAIGMAAATAIDLGGPINKAADLLARADNRSRPAHHLPRRGDCYSAHWSGAGHAD